MEEHPLMFFISTGLAGDEFAHSCSPETIFISPSFLKVNFTGYSVLGEQIFPFSALKITTLSKCTWYWGGG